jgi:hypothetical protein
VGSERDRYINEINKTSKWISKKKGGGRRKEVMRRRDRKLSFVVEGGKARWGGGVVMMMVMMWGLSAGVYACVVLGWDGIGFVFVFFVVGFILFVYSS